MRKCVFLFLLLVFVLAIASITENSPRVASASEEVALDVSKSSSNPENKALNNTEQLN
jgi:hypothetical protein